jgi:MFS family permease
MAGVDGRAADRDATQPMSVASTAREPNRWAVLALLSVAQLMVVLDATIVTIAIPSAQEALHFSTQSRQWIVTAFLQQQLGLSPLTSGLAFLPLTTVLVSPRPPCRPE